MSELHDYLKLFITPPVEDACVLVARPEDIDPADYLKEVTEEGALTPTLVPMVHGIILLGEPTESQADNIFKILKAGAHVILIPDGALAHKGAIALEDKGLEVRDCFYLAEDAEEINYTKKASVKEREAGLDTLPLRSFSFIKYEGENVGEEVEGDEYEEGEDRIDVATMGLNKMGKRRNIHPTVKPIDIMKWCARDIPEGSLVVDPFLGSGTTGCAMPSLGHDFIGIELNPEYASLCQARIQHWAPLGVEIESENPAPLEKEKKKGMTSLF